MKCLLDTHTLLWALTDDYHLTEEIKDLIIDEKNIIYVSVASIWEIQLKHSIYPNFPYSAKEIMNFCQRAGYIFLSIGVESVTEIDNLILKDTEFASKDPFDKLLLSQAKVNNMKFLTHDHVFKHYNESCIVHF